MYSPRPFSSGRFQGIAAAAQRNQMPVGFCHELLQQVALQFSSGFVIAAPFNTALLIHGLGICLFLNSNGLKQFAIRALRLPMLLQGAFISVDFLLQRFLTLDGIGNFPTDRFKRILGSVFGPEHVQRFARRCQSPFGADQTTLELLFALEDRQSVPNVV